MASFSITEYTTNSVTISASGLTSGNTIRFFIRLTEDTSDITVDEEFAASGSTMTKTFDGLSPETGYTVNIHDGTEWVGAQDFTTEAEPKVSADGRLLDIPVLDSTFPLFDWEDWPDSESALVSGGQTAAFEKEAWNAIVDTLADALESAGISWSTTYTTAEEAKITEEYGDLYAKAFNSLRHNIDRPASLGWAWAQRLSFRGHVGREDFRGVDQYGTSADDVYPEYIRELVRKLNLLIEIMRGTADTAEARHQALFQTLYEMTARAAQALRIEGFRALISSEYDATAREGISAPAFPQGKLFKTVTDGHVRAGDGNRVRPAQSLHKSLSVSGMTFLPGVNVSPESTRSETRCEALILSHVPRDMVVEEISESTSQTNARAINSTPAEGEGLSGTESTAAVAPVASAPQKGEEISRSDGTAQLDFVPATPFSGAVLSGSVAECVLSFQDCIKINSISRTSTMVVISTLWEPPIWVGDYLWIRQGHENTAWLRDGLLIREAFINTAWIEGGLLILEVHDETTLTDSVLEVG